MTLTPLDAPLGLPVPSHRRDLEASARWCAQLGIHPLAAELRHLDLWVRSLSTKPQPRTGRPASIVRRLSALARFYDYGVHDARVLTERTRSSV